MRSLRVLVVTALLVALATTSASALPPAQSGQRAPGGWAPAAEAEITPGVQMVTGGAQCTGNFVFTDRAGRIYVGYAAHCAGLGEATDTDGCTARSLPLGTRVRFARGATLGTRGETVGRGRLVYSSWLSMQRLGTTGSRPCGYNDLALVRVDRKDRGSVNPSVPFWGGPVGVAGALPDEGARVYTWGQSSLRPTTTLSPKTGLSLGRSGGGWTFDTYTATPGVPGDSGSGYLDPVGRAVGVLSTVAIAPLAGSNGVGSLRRELRFARAHSGIAGLRLVPGTEPFRPVP